MLLLGEFSTIAFLFFGEFEIIKIKAVITTDEITRIESMTAFLDFMTSLYPNTSNAINYAILFAIIRQ